MYIFAEIQSGEVFNVLGGVFFFDDTIIYFSRLEEQPRNSLERKKQYNRLFWNRFPGKMNQKERKKPKFCEM